MKSILSIPLIQEDKVIGAADFSYFRHHRKWPKEIIQRLRILGEIFTNAMMRKRMEETLRIEKERFEVLVEHSPLGIAFIESNGEYKYVNPKWMVSEINRKRFSFLDNTP